MPNLGESNVFSLAPGDGAKRLCHFGDSYSHQPGDIEHEVCERGPSENVARLYFTEAAKTGGARKIHGVSHFGELLFHLAQQIRRSAFDGTIHPYRLCDRRHALSDRE